MAAAFAAQAHSLFRRFLNKVRQAGKSFARPNPITHSVELEQEMAREELTVRMPFTFMISCNKSANDSLSILLNKHNYSKELIT